MLHLSRSQRKAPPKLSSRQEVVAEQLPRRETASFGLPPKLQFNTHYEGQRRVANDQLYSYFLVHSSQPSHAPYTQQAKAS